VAWVGSAEGEKGVGSGRRKKEEKRRKMEGYGSGRRRKVLKRRKVASFRCTQLMPQRLK
jgi:hypothetical protein